MKSLKCTLLFVLILATTTLKSQVAEFAAGITTSAAIGKVTASLQGLVNKSLDRGDYSVAQASIRALGIIDAWKQSNSELLETAFDKLDEGTRNMFANASALANQADNLIQDNLERTRQITENANQISESIIGSKKRSFILRYTPMVIEPTVKDSVLVRLRGVNLDQSNPQVNVGDIKNVQVSMVGPQEMSFWLPLSALKINNNKSEVHSINITHQTRDGSRWLFWPKYKKVERSLLIGTLPTVVASYELTAVRSFNEVEVIDHTADMGKFSGRNESVEKIAEPPVGYLWDLRSGVQARKDFSIVSTGSGEAGKCQEIIWNGSNEHGIKGRARLDEIRQIRDFSVRYSDGYKHCGIKGPAYREIPTTEQVNLGNRNLIWGVDQIVSLPNDVSSFALKIKLYTGEERIITNSFSDKLLDVIKEPNRLIIRTKSPTDIVE